MRGAGEGGPYKARKRSVTSDHYTRMSILILSIIGALNFLAGCAQFKEWYFVKITDREVKHSGVSVFRLCLQSMYKSEI